MGFVFTWGRPRLHDLVRVAILKSMVDVRLFEEVAVNPSRLTLLGLVCAAVLGCNSDLSRQDAASTIEDHLRSHAPRRFQMWADSGWAGHVFVDAVLMEVAGAERHDA